MPFEIQISNILTFSGDAIINPTDASLSGSGGLDAQIHRAAGLRFRLKCARISGLATGEAVMTHGGHLPCRYVIHTSAPFWTGKPNDTEQLRNCYRSALAVAEKHDLEKLAFPLIGSGTKGFPKELVLRVAAEEISAYLEKHADTHILLVVHDKALFQPEPELLSGLALYIREIKRKESQEEQTRPMLDATSTGVFPAIDANALSQAEQGTEPSFSSAKEPAVYPEACESAAPTPMEQPKIQTPTLPQQKKRETEFKEKGAPIPDVLQQEEDVFGDVYAPLAAFFPSKEQEELPIELDEPLSTALPEEDILPESFDSAPFDPSDLDRRLILDESFSEMVMRKIDERGFKKDSECYTKANLDRRLFSRIRCDNQYHPKKATALALAIALELSLDETNELLMKAGYSLSHSIVSDVIVEYCIMQRRYNIFEVNELLFQYDQALLGG